ncbi:Neuronal acetylcholine receptor subunit alpha-9-I [Pseudolycoriella hygida]|uniref:Neuronal acetylcholine receptor subunit alpha-9-I n=1 Tax=Pseudolycoriella hygida TaxID=35572 RepID=A0A9Q0S6Q0_9DIPT|nr:Neuronal acetylcholine receptor subunit alpha-9-I [Pseudolycoriella hygida]
MPIWTHAGIMRQHPDMAIINTSKLKIETGDFGSVANTNELEETKGGNNSYVSLMSRVFSNMKVLSTDTRNISVQFALRQISFEANAGVLSTKGKFLLSWNYVQNLWDPSEYDGVKNGLRVPPIFLLNSKDSQIKGLNIDFKIKLNYDGEANAVSTDVSLNTICSDISNVRNWPMDDVFCDIQLGVISGGVTLSPAKENFFQINGNDRSEWNIVDTHFLRNFSSITPVDITELNPVQLVYKLHLKRATLFYNKIFYGPLIVSFAFILVSFWTKHFLRAGLNLTGMLILNVMFTISMDYSPKSYVPQILKFYQISIYLSWFAFLLFIVTGWVERVTSKIQPFDWLAKCMQFTWLRLLVGLDIPNNYDQLEKEDFSWESY